MNDLLNALLSCILCNIRVTDSCELFPELMVCQFAHTVCSTCAEYLRTRGLWPFCQVCARQGGVQAGSHFATNRMAHELARGLVMLNNRRKAMTGEENKGCMGCRKEMAPEEMRGHTLDSCGMVKKISPAVTRVLGHVPIGSLDFRSESHHSTFSLVLPGRRVLVLKLERLVGESLTHQTVQVKVWREEDPEVEITEPEREDLTISLIAKGLFGAGAVSHACCQVADSSAMLRWEEETLLASRGGGELWVAVRAEAGERVQRPGKKSKRKEDPEGGERRDQAQKKDRRDKESAGGGDKDYTFDLDDLLALS